MKERILPLDPPFDPEVSEHLRKLMPPGMPPIRLFRTLAHNPRVLGRIRRGGLLDPGSVSLRARELVIMRTTALCRAEYEWSVHVAFFSQAAELSAAEVEATVRGDSEPFAPAERLLFELCEALHAEAKVPDVLWARLAETYSTAQLIELVTLAGQYHTVSYLVNALGVALEPDAPRFPEPA